MNGHTENRRKEYNNRERRKNVIHTDFNWNCTKEFSALFNAEPGRKTFFLVTYYLKTREKRNERFVEQNIET